MDVTYKVDHRTIHCGVNKHIIGGVTEAYEFKFTITRHHYTRKYKITVTSLWELEKQKAYATLGARSKTISKTQKLQDFLVSHGLEKIPDDILAALK